MQHTFRTFFKIPCSYRPSHGNAIPKPEQPSTHLQDGGHLERSRRHSSCGSFRLIRPLLFCIILLNAAASGCRKDPAEEKHDVEGTQKTPEELSLGFAPEPEMPPQSPSRSNADVPASSMQSTQPELPVDANMEEIFSRLDTLKQNAAFSDAWQLAREFRTQHANHPRISELDERIVQLNRLRRDSLELQHTLPKIADASPTVRDIVQREFILGGDAALILLRKTVRDASAELSLAAAELLARMGDTEGFQDVFIRMISADNAELIESYMPICAQMIEEQTEAGLQRVAAFLHQANDAAFVPLASAVYRRLRELPDVVSAPSIRTTVNSYLLRIGERTQDRTTLRSVSEAAAFSGDDNLTAKFLQPGLQYFYYEGSRSQIVDMEQMDSKTNGVTADITLNLRKRNEDIAFVFKGLLDLPDTGEYTFSTISDDGSYLFIGEEMVVDNGGMHGMQERSGTISLTKGLHPFKVTFYQGGGGLGLEVYWQPPESEKESIPPDRFYHQLTE